MLDDEELRRLREENVKSPDTVPRIMRGQGSFGLWGADGQEEYWLTAYVTDFLLRARDQGFAVPPEALKKASQRLLRYVQERNVIEADASDNL